jgi:hypothetical protein
VLSDVDANSGVVLPEIGCPGLLWRPPPGLSRWARDSLVRAELAGAGGLEPGLEILNRANCALERLAQFAGTFAPVR